MHKHSGRISLKKVRRHPDKLTPLSIKTLTIRLIAIIIILIILRLISLKIHATDRSFFLMKEPIEQPCSETKTDIYVTLDDIDNFVDFIEKYYPEKNNMEPIIIEVTKYVPRGILYHNTSNVIPGCLPAISLEEKETQEQTSSYETTNESEDSNLLNSDDPNFHCYTSFCDPYSGVVSKINMSEYYQKVAYAACQKYGVDFNIAMGLFGAETSWDAEIGIKGAYVGIGMLSTYYNEYTYAQKGINIYTPEGGIEASVHLLSVKLATWGDIHCALIAYNCGDSGAKYGYFNNGYYSSYYSRRVIQIANNIW